MATNQSTGGRLATASLLTTFVLLACSQSWSQSVSTARWRSDAKAAHSIVHDDFGESWFGDINTMDSLAYNRQICVTFGTIALRAGVPWPHARALFARGHRFVSHSGTHIMSDGLDWNLAQEIDSSRAVIERNIPGNKVLFFCAPGDRQLAPSVKDYIRAHGWIGIRGGCWQQNPYNIPDPFSTCVVGNDLGNATGGALNQQVDTAISHGNWWLLETHQIGLTGGYYPMDAANWRTHLDYCVQKRLSGELWTAPIQEVLMYALERNCWKVAVTSSDATTMHITFNTDSVVNAQVANRTFDVPLTLLAVLPSGWVAADAQVVQNAQVLTHTLTGTGTIRFDAAPWGGTVTVNRTPVVAVQRLAPVRNAPAEAWYRAGIARQLLTGHAGAMACSFNGRRTGAEADQGLVVVPAPGHGPDAVRLIMVR
jgi:hypothetical protein